MSKDTTITAQNGGSAAKPSAGKQRIAKPAVSEPRAAKPNSAKKESLAPAKAVATAPTKAAVKKAAKAVAKVSGKAAGRAGTKTKTSAEPARKVAAAKPVAPKTIGIKSAGIKSIVPAEPVIPNKAAASVPSFRLPMQVALPAAVAMNTKLVDIAQSNVSAGLELARDLAGARTPMDVMRLGVAYWFKHMGAVQAQARELQSLSAAWVKTAGEQMRAR